MTTLKPFIAGLKPGTPIMAGNLRLVPFTRQGEPAVMLDYQLTSEAIERGTLLVTEVHAEGVVAELLAASTAAKPVLFVDGEELVGAKQNRILNTDVLLRAKGEVKIPVSCVEQGRWRSDRPDFAPGECSPSSLRAKKSRSVSHNLRAENAARSDQGAVWSDVQNFLGCMSADSDTDAMAAAFEQRRGDLDAIVESLPYAEGGVGVAAFIDGEFVVLDLFDQSATLAALWRRLVLGYAADSLVGRSACTSRPALRDPETLLDRLGEVPCEKFAGVDLGEDWRFGTSEFAGSALVFEQQALHLSVFPSGSESIRQDRRPSGRVVSPSRRRKSRRRPLM